MTNEPEHTDVFVPRPSMVEIDAERIYEIILQTCHSSATDAARASNLILEYLAEAHQAASKSQ